MIGKLLVTAFLVSAAAAPLAAATVYTATLSGLNEVPVSGSAGTGTATVTIDGNSMRVQVTYSGLNALTSAGLPNAVTASHIHCCQTLGTNAQVATTTPTFPGFPTTLSGFYDQIFDLDLASSYNPAFVTAHGSTVGQAKTDLLAGLAAGQTYLNIHTLAVPGGEIRGQLLLAVPEPSTWAMMLVGFVAAGGALRMRRKVAMAA